MAKHRAPELYPLPVHGLFNDPRYVALPTAGVGMLWRIIDHYWRSACAPLPTQGDGLFAIARCHRPTWKTHKLIILDIFNDYAPVMKAYHERRTTGRHNLAILSHKGGTVAARRKALQAVGVDSLTPAPSQALPVTMNAKPPAPVKTPATAGRMKDRLRA